MISDKTIVFINSLPALRSVAVLCIMWLCFIITANAQTTPPQTTTPPATAQEENEKTKFFSKIGHWLTTYSLGEEDFMADKRNDFKSAAFAEVYVEGVLDYDTWLFNLLNRVSSVRIEQKQDPHIIIRVKFKPADSKLDKYTLKLELQGSSKVALSMDKIAEGITKKYFDGKTFEEPSGATSAVEGAITEVLATLKEKLGTSLAPDLMVRFQNELFWDGHKIAILDSDGNSIELEAVGKDKLPLASSSIQWTNADPASSKGIVDMTGVTTKSVTLSKLGTNDKMTVTLQRANGKEDINDMLKQLIIEVLSAKKKEAQDSIQKLKQDSVVNEKTTAELIAKIEAANFQLEDDGSTLTPMFTSPLVYEEPKDFTNDNKDNRVQSFLSLKKRKKIRSDIRRKVNVVALADLITDHPDEVKLLLDELLKNSGRLIAQLILNTDGDGKKAAARNIVIDFLNKNLERIAGGQYTEAQSQYPVLTITPATPTPPAFRADKYVYINPYANFVGKDSLEAALNKYMATLDTPTYVFVNYSQDNSRAGYLARGKLGRPKGLPVGAKYKVFVLINMPGSFEADWYDAKGGCGGDTPAEAIGGCVNEDEESAMVATLNTAIEIDEESFDDILNDASQADIAYMEKTYWRLREENSDKNNFAGFEWTTARLAYFRGRQDLWNIFRVIGKEQGYLEDTKTDFADFLIEVAPDIDKLPDEEIHLLTTTRHKVYLELKGTNMMLVSSTAFTVASIYYPIVTAPLERALANPILQARAAKVLAKLADKVKNVMDAAGRIPWKGFANIFKATADEVAAAALKIKNYRNANNLKGGNYGYLEGTVNGKAVDSKMWRSVALDQARKEAQIFEAIEVTGNSGTWLRITDSEYRMLNSLASELKAVKGGRYPNITGELKVISENPYCASCVGIIQQFNQMFPNIKLILVDGAK